jgi:hypothetical protein
MAISFGSQFCHFFNFLKLKLKQPSVRFERGLLIISVDIDVGHRNVALLNEGKNDRNVHNYLSEYEVGVIEETAIPLFLDLFDHFSLPVTLAVRGQLLEVGEFALTPLLKSPVKHEIGAHGYSHRSFQDLSLSEAEKELNLLFTMMKRFSIVPKSFVFPKNRVAHLNLLEKYGYRCYREYGDFVHDGMYIAKRNQLYDVHPSFHIDQYTNYIFLKEMLNICVRNKLPFHVWFHLWSFGKDDKSIQKAIQRIFVPFLKYAEVRVNEGVLASETMFSAIERLEDYLVVSDPALSSINGLKHVRET